MLSFLRRKKNSKIFCIGLNKTGTTSIESFFMENGYTVGDQAKAEYLIEDWYKRDFKSTLEYCENYDAFQDVPFSLPYTFIFLEQHFPQAKFILTIRDSPEQWYSSLTAFHSKVLCNGTRIPNIQDLKSATYRYEGYAYTTHKAMFNTPDEDLYNKEILISYYENYVDSVQDYFRSKPEKLLVINVAKDGDYSRLCKFLEKPCTETGLSWVNKT